MAYLSAERPDLAAPRVPQLVGQRYREGVQEWTDGWIDRLLVWHHRQHGDWAAMAAWDSIAVGHPIPTPGPIGWASPFEHPRVRDVARAIALHRRYDGSAGSAYWRAKHLICELFPQAVRHALPRYKQTFTAELGNVEQPRVAPVSARHGLIDSAELEREQDSLFVSRVAAIEMWLSRAEQLGYQIN